VALVFAFLFSLRRQVVRPDSLSLLTNLPSAISTYPSGILNSLGYLGLLLTAPQGYWQRQHFTFALVIGKMIFLARYQTLPVLFLLESTFFYFIWFSG